MQRFSPALVREPGYWPSFRLTNGTWSDAKAGLAILFAQNGSVADRPIPRYGKPYRISSTNRANHKIPTTKYRVTNWPDYDAALVRRNALTIVVLKRGDRW